MSERVLIVDDEPANRKLLRVLVEHEQLCAVEASGGQEALDLLSEQQFDLVFLDMMMPGVDGLKVLQVLNERGTLPGLPVVIVTAHSERDLRIKALSLGAIDFLSKPLDILDLRYRLATLLELGRLRILAAQEAAVKAEQSLQARIDEAIGELPLVLYQNPNLAADSLGEWVVGDLKRVTGESGPVYFQSVWDDLVHPDDRPRVVATYREIEAGEKTNWHLQYRLGPGKRWVSHVGKFDQDAQSLFGTLVDISETKQLEAKFLQSQKMEAVGQLAGGIAHDFNNLLCAIISFAGFAREGLPVDDQRSADIEEVLKAADRAAGLTRQLLTFSRRKKAVKEVIELNERLDQLHKLLSRTLGEQIAFKVSPSPRPATIQIDPIQFDQVVLNLVVNARDAMPDGGVLEITLDSIYTTDGPRDQLVRLTVRDTGKGMDPQTLLRIFEPFFTTKDAGRGTGLGLATCFAIIEQASGEISVESVEGEGTIFTITWPLVPGEATAEKVERLPARSGVGHSILVVEDEASLRRVMKRVLEGAGYQVYTAVDGEEGKHKVDLLEGRLSAIVSDIVMPKMGGFQLAEYVYEAYPKVAMIFVTGYMDDTVDQIDPERAKLIWKPFQKDELLRVVEESIGAAAPPTNKKTKPGKPEAVTSKSSDREQIAPKVLVETDGTPDADHQKPRRESVRVLLVDDDVALCKASTRVLERDDMEVVVRGTLESARNALSEDEFDAIILDVHLPDGNGLDLLEKTGTTPVIVITGAPTGESAKRAVQGRVTAFLPKPVTPKELRSRVRGAVAEGRVSKIRSKLLASRHGGHEFIDDLCETEALFERALSSLYMEYQPIVRAEDHSIYGYEALLRCRETKLTSPMKFFAVAEILGRVEDVGRIVRSSVAETILDHKDRLETIFVNLHPCELSSGVLTGAATESLLSLAPRVVFEITERASLQSGQRLANELEKIRQLGYRLAIDDLGEGYAGLSSLVTVRPDIVKIDMSLVRNLHLAPLQIDIVDSIIDLAHRAGIVVVGEGVEIREERDVLVGLGCDLLQGYYIGRPGKPFSGIEQEFAKAK